MKKIQLSSLAIALATVGMSGTGYAADSVTEALEQSKATIDLRYRYENVDQDGIDDKANASTLRSRIGVQTGEVAGFSATADFEDVRAVGDDDYNSTLNGNSDFPVVADPEGTELNQAYLQYKQGDTTAKFGRQRVILDNARFVGNVGWRQNEQTYDGLTVANQSIENVTVVYGYVTDVRGITFGATNVTAHLLNASVDKLGPGKLSAYGYLIEMDDTEAELNTYGLRYAGKAEAGDLAILFTAEFATQEADDGTAAENPEADYTLLEAGVQLKNGLTVKVGQEVLGSDDGAYAFDTPLATKHAFNGWADKFLSTDPAGLEDTYVNISGKVAGVKLAAIFHDFAANEGNAEYGSEVDLLAVKKFTEHYSAGVKAADYQADDFGTDTKKVWLWGQAKF